MTASVITKLTAVKADATWTETPYALEIKGQPAHGTTIKEILEPTTGQKVIRIMTALAPTGVPVLPLPTQDQVARRIAEGARVVDYIKGKQIHIRDYAVVN
jgi:hypothetical protein